MLISLQKHKETPFHKALSITVALAFSMSMMMPPQSAYAQNAFSLPLPGVMVNVSPTYCPVMLRGIKVHPEKPFEFDFIVDSGDTGLAGQSLKDESTKLVKYFLASLTVPEKDLWVNLSPHEKDRIIPEGFGLTEMGRDLLAQDYILKQLTASLIYPEDELGKKFWDRVYKKAHELYGTTEIPMNTFNKVWIIPEKAVVYEHQGTAFVAESHLKVMLEEDYETFKKSQESSKSSKTLAEKGMTSQLRNQVSDVSASIVKEIVLPEIEKEINEGKNFAQLRQIYHSLILASWYKRSLRETILSKVYVDKNKVVGVDVEDKEVKQKIYEQYLEAYQKGVYNYIKDDYDKYSKQMIPRKYFSGGVSALELTGKTLRVEKLEKGPDGAMLTKIRQAASKLVGPAMIIAVSLFLHGDQGPVKIASGVAPTGVEVTDPPRGRQKPPQEKQKSSQEKQEVSQETKVAEELHPSIIDPESVFEVSKEVSDRISKMTRSEVESLFLSTDPYGRTQLPVDERIRWYKSEEIKFLIKHYEISVLVDLPNSKIKELPFNRMFYKNEYYSEIQNELLKMMSNILKARVEDKEVTDYILAQGISAFKQNIAQAPFAMNPNLVGFYGFFDGILGLGEELKIDKIVRGEIEKTREFLRTIVVQERVRVENKRSGARRDDLELGTIFDVIPEEHKKAIEGAGGAAVESLNGVEKITEYNPFAGKEVTYERATAYSDEQRLLIKVGEKIYEELVVKKGLEEAWMKAVRPSLRSSAKEEAKYFFGENYLSIVESLYQFGQGQVASHHHHGNGTTGIKYTFQETRRFFEQRIFEGLKIGRPVSMQALQFQAENLGSITDGRPRLLGPGMKLDDLGNLPEGSLIQIIPSKPKEKPKEEKKKDGAMLVHWDSAIGERFLSGLRDYLGERPKGQNGNIGSDDLQRVFSRFSFVPRNLLEESERQNGTYLAKYLTDKAMELEATNTTLATLARLSAGEVNRIAHKKAEQQSKKSKPALEEDDQDRIAIDKQSQHLPDNVNITEIGERILSLRTETRKVVLEKAGVPINTLYELEISPRADVSLKTIVQLANYFGELNGVTLFTLITGLETEEPFSPYDFQVVKEHLGKNIRRIREEKGISQSQLEKMLGVGEDVLWKIENGTIVKLNSLVKIAKVLDVPISSLLRQNIPLDHMIDRIDADKQWVYLPAKFDVSKISLRLRDLRLRKGYSQARVASEIGLHEDRIAFLENRAKGKNMFLESVVKYANYFNVSIFYILAGKETEREFELYDYEAIKARWERNAGVIYESGIYTKQQISTLTGVQPNSWSSYSRGEVLVSLNSLNVISKGLGIPIDVLLGETEKLEEYLKKVSTRVPVDEQQKHLSGNSRIIGENLRKHRKLRKFSFEKVYKESGVTYQMLKGLEEGHVPKHSIQNILALANYYQIPMFELLTGKRAENQGEFIPYDDKLFAETFVSHLRFLLKARGISAYALGPRAGISRQAIEQFLDKKSLPSMVSLVKITQAFNIPIDHMFRIDGSEAGQAYLSNASIALYEGGLITRDEYDLAEYLYIMDEEERQEIIDGSKFDDMDDVRMDLEETLKRTGIMNENGKLNYTNFNELVARDYKESIFAPEDIKQADAAMLVHWDSAIGDRFLGELQDYLGERPKGQNGNIGPDDVREAFSRFSFVPRKLLPEKERQNGTYLATYLNDRAKGLEGRNKPLATLARLSAAEINRVASQKAKEQFSNGRKTEPKDTHGKISLDEQVKQLPDKISMKALGARIKSWRTESLKVMEKKASLAERTIYDLQGGKGGDVKLKTIIKVANYFRVPLFTLITGLETEELFFPHDYETVQQCLGENVRSIRKKRGILQSQLAEILGIEEYFLSRVENGLDFVQTSLLIKIAKALNVPLSSLLRQNIPLDHMIDRVEADKQWAYLPANLDVSKISQRLKDLRLGKGESILEMVAGIGLHKDHISLLENKTEGKNMLLQTIVKYANYFHVSIFYILTGKETEREFESYDYETIKTRWKRNAEVIYESENHAKQHILRLTGVRSDRLADKRGTGVVNLNPLNGISRGLRIPIDIMLGETEQLEEYLKEASARVPVDEQQKYLSGNRRIIGGNLLRHRKLRNLSFGKVDRESEVTYQMLKGLEEGHAVANSVQSILTLANYYRIPIFELLTGKRTEEQGEFYPYDYKLFTETFVSNLKFLFRVKGVAQAEVGRKAGVSTQAINNILYENNLPGLPLLVKITQALNIPIDHIFKLDGSEAAQAYLSNAIGALREGELITSEEYDLAEYLYIMDEEERQEIVDGSKFDDMGDARMDLEETLKRTGIMNEDGRFNYANFKELVARDYKKSIFGSEDSDQSDAAMLVSEGLSEEQAQGLIDVLLSGDIVTMETAKGEQFRFVVYYQESEEDEEIDFLSIRLLDQQDQIVGFVEATLNSSNRSALLDHGFDVVDGRFVDSGEKFALKVEKPFKRRRIAQTLMGLAMRIAKREGIDEFKIAADPGTDEFYESIGFRRSPVQEREGVFSIAFYHPEFNQHDIVFPKIQIKDKAMLVSEGLSEEEIAGVIKVLRTGDHVNLRTSGGDEFILVMDYQSEEAGDSWGDRKRIRIEIKNDRGVAIGKIDFRIRFDEEDFAKKAFMDNGFHEDDVRGRFRADAKNLHSIRTEFRENRGRGMGKALMGLAMRVAKKEGADRFEVDMIVPSAKSFYEKVGFQGFSEERVHGEQYFTAVFRGLRNFGTILPQVKIKDKEMVTIVEGRRALPERDVQGMVYRLLEGESVAIHTLLGKTFVFEAEYLESPEGEEDRMRIDVATTEEGFVGFIDMRIDPKRHIAWLDNGFDQDDEGKLVNSFEPIVALGVIDAYRRIGLGKTLVGLAMRVAKRKGAKRFELNEVTTSARPFYSEIGFKPLSDKAISNFVFQNFYRDDVVLPAIQIKDSAMMNDVKDPELEERTLLERFRSRGRKEKYGVPVDNAMLTESEIREKINYWKENWPNMKDQYVAPSKITGNPNDDIAAVLAGVKEVTMVSPMQRLSVDEQAQFLEMVHKRGIHMEEFPNYLPGRTLLVIGDQGRADEIVKLYGQVNQGLVLVDRAFHNKLGKLLGYGKKIEEFIWEPESFGPLNERLDELGLTYVGHAKIKERISSPEMVEDVFNIWQSKGQHFAAKEGADPQLFYIEKQTWPFSLDHMTEIDFEKLEAMTGTGGREKDVEDKSMLTEWEITQKRTRWSNWRPTAKAVAPGGLTDDSTDDIAAVIFSNKPAAMVRKRTKESTYSDQEIREQQEWLEYTKTQGLEVREFVNYLNQVCYAVGEADKVDRIIGMNNGFNKGKDILDDGFHRRLGQLLGYGRFAEKYDWRSDPEKLGEITQALNKLDFEQTGRIKVIVSRRDEKKVRFKTFGLWQKGSALYAVDYESKIVFTGPLHLPWHFDELQEITIDIIEGTQGGWDRSGDQAMFTEVEDYLYNKYNPPQEVKKALRFLQDPEAKVILDIGTGDGALAKARAEQGYKVIGIDAFEAGGLHYGDFEKRVEEIGEEESPEENFVMLRADGNEVIDLLSDNSIDEISLVHIDNNDLYPFLALLKSGKIQRKIKPGGRIIIKPFIKLDTQQITLLKEELEFKQRRSGEVFGPHIAQISSYNFYFPTAKPFTWNKPKDKAVFTKGGVDFNPNNMNLEIKGDGSASPSSESIFPDELQNINFDGLSPVIINIVPATNIPAFFGISSVENLEPVAGSV